MGWTANRFVRRRTHRVISGAPHPRDNRCKKGGTQNGVSRGWDSAAILATGSVTPYGFRHRIEKSEWLHNFFKTASDRTC